MVINGIKNKNKPFMINEFIATEWEWVRTSVLLKDGTWLHDTIGNRVELRDNEDLFWIECHPYMNITNSMKVQMCDATVQIWEREWQWNGISKVDKDIDVQFSKELGSGAGSWKGGVIGCNYEMIEGETPLETLRRMERERQFK
jgi:hypothetical protein